MTGNNPSLPWPWPVFTSCRQLDSGSMIDSPLAECAVQPIISQQSSLLAPSFILFYAWLSIMARIKFTTAPTSAVQVQSARVLHEKKSATSTRKKTQAEIENPAKSAVSEGLFLKQQQSLEMVQIMLHVSVSAFKSNYLGYLLIRAMASLGHYFIFGACRRQCSLNIITILMRTS